MFVFSFLKLLSQEEFFYVAVFSKTLDYQFTEDEGLFSCLDLCLHPEVLLRALHRFNFKLLYQLDFSLCCLYNLVCSDQKG